MGHDCGRRRQRLPLPLRVLGVLVVLGILVTVPAWLPAAALAGEDPGAVGAAREMPKVPLSRPPRSEVPGVSGLDSWVSASSRLLGGIEGAAPSSSASSSTTVGVAGPPSPSPVRSGSTDAMAGRASIAPTSNGPTSKGPTSKTPTSNGVPSGGSGPWLWPLDPDPAVTRRFNGPAKPWLPGHRGVDLAATPGQEVRAPAAGRVSFAGVVVDRGVLTVDHPGGLRTSYEPVTALVAVGEEVRSGQVIGVVQATPGHCRPAACLHWGLRRDRTYLDPLNLLIRPGAPVLLPLGGWAPDAAPGLRGPRPR